jgi:protein O-GlcNAc transferase
LSAEEVLAAARTRLASGDIAGARSACAQVLASGNPHDAAAADLVLSACARRAGDAASAKRHVESALARDPGNALAHYAFAEIAEGGGDADAAIASLEQAVRLSPTFVSAHHLLGILYGERGDAARAADAFARVVALDPRNARGHNNLGNALRVLGRLDDARNAFERAVALKPDYALAIANVAVMWRDAGEVERAEALLKAALAPPTTGKPPLRAIVVALAGLLRERGALDEALPLYEQAIAMAPSASAGEWFNLGRVYAERDEPERARDAYRRSVALDHKDLRGAIGSRLSLPMIYADADDAARARDRYAEGLADLHRNAGDLVAGSTPDEVLDGLRWTNFFLAYQGRDDRELQASYGRFVARAIELGAPGWRAPLVRRHSDRKRLRVGFASAFFHVGTAGRYFRSWLTDLDRERFEVVVYHLYPGLDDIAREIKSRADKFVEFGGSRARPSVVAPAIRDDALDVLVYPELGMDHTSFVLGGLRLAPRQLAGWGHPVTSGHATIDGFISCAEMEPPGADRHYVERLLRLPGIGTCYRRPALPEHVPRARFHLPDDRVLLLCPQSLFKVHPDNDALLARVLAANPRATLVMFDGRHPRVTDLFVQRISRTFDAHGLSARERLIVLPPLPHDDYLRVNLACDAMVDTLHWSGGNTSLDALACALPVVTLPGDYMRGRQSAAMLALAGTPELIARGSDDYVRIASRLVEDAGWRKALASTIRDGHRALFDTKRPVEAFADLLGVAGASPDVCR